MGSSFAIGFNFLTASVLANDQSVQDDDDQTLLYAGIFFAVLIAAVVAYMIIFKGKNDDVDQITIDDFVPKDAKGRVSAAYLDPADTLLQLVDANK
jgi:hypothetical protein